VGNAEHEWWDGRDNEGDERGWFEGEEGPNPKSQPRSEEAAVVAVVAVAKMNT
jgi:hypothetical protein